MARKNLHAVALGRKGGLANTAKQKRARKKPKHGVGRKPVICELCGRPGRAHWWYRGEKRCPIAE